MKTFYLFFTLAFSSLFFLGKNNDLDQLQEVDIRIAHAYQIEYRENITQLQPSERMLPKKKEDKTKYWLDLVVSTITKVATKNYAALGWDYLSLYFLNRKEVAHRDWEIQIMNGLDDSLLPAFSYIFNGGIELLNYYILPSKVGTIIVGNQYDHSSSADPNGCSGIIEIPLGNYSCSLYIGYISNTSHGGLYITYASPKHMPQNLLTREKLDDKTLWKTVEKEQWNLFEIADNLRFYVFFSGGLQKTAKFHLINNKFPKLTAGTTVKKLLAPGKYFIRSALKDNFYIAINVLNVIWSFHLDGMTPGIDGWEFILVDKTTGEYKIRSLWDSALYLVAYHFWGNKITIEKGYWIGLQKESMIGSGYSNSQFLWKVKVLENGYTEITTSFKIDGHTDKYAIDTSACMNSNDHRGELQDCAWEKRAKLNKLVESTTVKDLDAVTSSHLILEPYMTREVVTTTTPNS